MAMTPMRFFLTLPLLAFAASSLCSQGPKDLGADIKAISMERTKASKPESTPPLYTVPKTTSWWNGGGPGPAGAGAD